MDGGKEAGEGGGRGAIGGVGMVDRGKGWYLGFRLKFIEVGIRGRGGEGMKR